VVKITVKNGSFEVVSMVET